MWAKRFLDVRSEKDSIVWFERKEWAGESNVHFCVYYSKRTKAVHTVIAWLFYDTKPEAIRKRDFYYRKFHEEYEKYDNELSDKFMVAIYNEKFNYIIDGVISLKLLQNYVGIMFYDCESEDTDIYEDLLTDYY